MFPLSEVHLHHLPLEVLLSCFVIQCPLASSLHPRINPSMGHIPLPSKLSHQFMVLGSLLPSPLPKRHTQQHLPQSPPNRCCVLPLSSSRAQATIGMRCTCRSSRTPIIDNCENFLHVLLYCSSAFCRPSVSECYLKPLSLDLTCLQLIALLEDLR